MTQDHISISFTCKNCGTKLSWPEDAADDLAIACSGCGALAGTYGELKETAVNAAKQKIDDIVKDAFKKFK